MNRSKAIGFAMLLSGGSSAVFAQTPALPAGEGKAIVQRACAQCHALSIVTTADHSPEDWAIVVKAMVHQGAKLSPDEVPVVTEYLSKSFPKAADASDPAQPSTAPAPKGLPAGY